MDVISLIPSFGGFFSAIGAFVVALSVVVTVHEYGHYIVGRWSGIHADVFSLGFGPVLISRRDRRGTLWQIALLPLGGYVKFAGDANAASVGQADTPGLDPAERRRTMHGAPLWARAATVAAGPIFNFILSIAVFAAVVMIRGVPSDPLTIEEVLPLPAEVQELRQGDEIVAIAGREAPDLEGFGAFVDKLPKEPVLNYEVLRGEERVTVRAPYPMPAAVGGVTPQSAAGDVDMRVGDVITAVDGAPIFAFDQLREKVAASDGATLELDVWRPGPGEGSNETFVLAPRRVDLPAAEGGFETRWLIGITGGLLFEPRTQMPGPFEAIAHGARQTVYIVQTSLSGLYHMATRRISTCNLSGPIGMAEQSLAAAKQGLNSFVGWVAVLSAAIGFLNLLPIPVLDGGHLVFHGYEAITGRPPSDRALNVLMAIGLALLGTLMVFALTNDLFCP